MKFPAFLTGLSILTTVMCGTCFAQTKASINDAASKAETNVTLVPLMISEEVTGDLKLEPLPYETKVVINFLESQLPIRFDLQRQPWKRALDKAFAGEGMIFGISKTAERLKHLNFSEPFYDDNVWLVTRCDSQFSFNGLPDLKGKTIGVVRGASAGEEFDAQANKLFKIEDDTGQTQGRFTKLYQRRMDALIFFKANSNPVKLARELNRLYLPKDHPSDQIGGNFCVLNKPVATTSVHIALQKNRDQSLLQKINQTVLAGRKSGLLQKLMAGEK